MAGAGALKLLVGLGNPGPAYQYTLHNMGHLVLDCLLADHIKGHEKQRGEGIEAQLEFGGQLYRTLKPQTFMNLSGPAVQACLAYWRIEPKEMLVIHDDVDLVPGQLKVKWSGGAGGHNGLKSLFECLGPDFYRLRVGVGKMAGRDTASHVLTRLNRAILSPLISSGYECLRRVLEQGPAQAMNEINRAMSATSDEEE